MSLTETHLYQEIREQPAVVSQFLQQEQATIAALAKAIQQQGVTHVVIAARGTSDNAGRYAKYVLGAFNGLQVALATPSLFSLYQRPIQFKNALVLGISQSGQSPDIVAVLAEARRQGQLTAAITNTPNSPLAQEADFVINLHAGAEKAVAATKTYTSSLIAIASLSAVLAEDAQMQYELAQVSGWMQAALGCESAVTKIAERLRYMQHCVVIGRGFNYATAFEIALKMKELTYSIVEPYSSADFLHGPFAVLNPGFPVIVVAPTGALSAMMLEFVEQLHQASAEIIAISDHAPTLDKATLPIKLPSSSAEWLTPLTTILPGQLLAMHLAHTRHLNVDAPRAIHKVTETR